MLEEQYNCKVDEPSSLEKESKNGQQLAPHLAG
jgi:hypothetical protein